jgi:hypothetical protein
MPRFLNSCINVVESKGALIPHCFAFLNGTYMAVCCPNENQREIYSGYKANHSLKYHALSTPNGIIIYLGGPFSGRRHNSKLLEKSKLKSLLFQYAKSSDGTLLVIYGNEGYSRSGQVETPFRQTQLTPDRIIRNESMRRPRLLAE